MKISKQARRDAKQLFTTCKVGGLLDEARVEQLRNTVIPSQVDVSPSRNYGATADAKARKLIQKLLFATASVVALVFLALGRREAAIVGAAVIVTLAATLFASWAWGFTINRVSLFALIYEPANSREHIDERRKDPFNRGTTPGPHDVERRTTWQVRHRRRLDSIPHWNRHSRCRQR